MARISGFSVGSMRRPVGPAQPLLVGIRPDRLASVVEAVEPPGRRVEHGDATLGVAGHDALFEGVEQHLEELLLLAQRVAAAWRLR